MISEASIWVAALSGLAAAYWVYSQHTTESAPQPELIPVRIKDR
ncbi:hypothetical protein [Almyronema epifaneia]|uniref:Uncharacterized protein n=1 Tax=Almyronema epifaneia S1 TaxID=2991925 RepID=A0ABW6IJY0_9CYAN